MLKIIKFTGLTLVAAGVQLACCLSAAVAASVDARSSGMGEANTAIASGAAAIYGNPANLAGHKGVSIGILQGGFGFGNNVVTMQDLLGIATGDTNTRYQYYENIIRATPSSGLAGGFSMGSLEGVVYNNYALSVGVQGYGRGVMSKDMVSYLLRPDIFMYRKVWWNIDATGSGEANFLISPVLTGGFKLWDMDVGLNIKPYTGGYYVKGDANITALWTNNNANPYQFITNAATVFSSTQPGGVGLDLGIAKNLDKNLRIAATVQNIGPNITWQGVREFKTASTSMPAGAAYPSLTINTVSTPATVSVPQNLTARVGVSYNADFYGPLLLACDYEAATFTRSGFHAGAEKYLGPVALRLGLTTNPYYDTLLFTAGAGVRIGAVSTDIAGMFGGGTNTGVWLNMVSDF